MEKYKQEFITFLATSNALQFGDFTLKSGRQSPYFINTGLFDTGEQIAKLGEFYAQAINDGFGKDFDIIYGPAYKGVPLCVTAAVTLSQKFNINKYYTFNRKEIKDHADKKLLVGHTPQAGERILIIDDVITDGGALIESMDILKSITGLKYAGVILSVNRQEKTKDEKNAIASFEKEYNMPIRFIVTVSEIITFLHNRKINGQTYITDEIKNKMEEYLKTYGV
ncbi:orotate phosphoribosyltransferase [Patescibacteria group bacterium]|nr:orotate phosphoribosyltransferase [Patescibacteria group bacterium]MBU0963888.1 orotate phosphoribosyltransferase [Patescibacteria group bacterium]